MTTDLLQRSEEVAVPPYKLFQAALDEVIDDQVLGSPVAAAKAVADSMGWQWQEVRLAGHSPHVEVRCGDGPLVVPRWRRWWRARPRTAWWQFWREPFLCPTRHRYYDYVTVTEDYADMARHPWGRLLMPHEYTWR